MDNPNKSGGDASVGRWHHAPLHYFVPKSIYFLTAGTFRKEHYFRGAERLTCLQEAVLFALEERAWTVEAWAFFSNHYHLVARAPHDADSLRTALQKAHSQTARFVNGLDGVLGPQVWFQYRDTCITSKRSYFARLKYVHFNAVKHRLVQCAEDYPYCSARRLMSEVNLPARDEILSMPIDRVKVDDDFE